MDQHSDKTEQQLYDETLLQFVSSCNEYCLWIEEMDISQAGNFVRDAMQHLSGIYSLAARLDMTEPVLEGGNEKHVTEQDWAEVFRKTQEVLGAHNSYLRIAEDEEYDRSDLVDHKISEDLADIYQDLKDFTMQFRQGLEEIMNDAVYEVLSSFEQYWGSKLLNALGALHRLYVKKTDLEAPGTPGTEEEDTPAYDNTFFRKFLDQSEEDDDV